MSLPIDRTNKAALDTNLVNGVLSDAPKIKASNDVVYNTIDELYNYALNLAVNGYTKTQIDNIIAQAIFGTPPAGGVNTTYLADQAVTMPKLATDVQNKLNQIYSTEREVANLKAISSIANRVDSASGIFYDLNDGLNGGSIGKIDLTKTNIVGTVAIGAVTITVKSVTGLIVGQEVTVFDDTNREYAIISAINTGAKQLTFAAPLTKAYQDQAEVARSTVTQDTLNRLIKFGGWSKQTTYTVTNQTVVAAAYDTSGNNGRKVVGPLTNGWYIAIEVNGTTIQVQKSIDNFATTPVALCSITGAQVGAAIAWNGGNSVTILWNSTTVVYSNTFDVTTVTNTDQNANKVIVDNGCTSIVNNMSIKTGSDGLPQGSWSGITAALPNSKNTRYSIATTTSVTAWAAPTQLTTSNTAGSDWTNPCVVVRSNNNPVIFYQAASTTNYSIYAHAFNGTSWTQYNAYNGSTYSQSNPSAYIKTKGSNIGRIILRWHGLDATDTAKQNERWSYSDDGGVTWSAAVKITTGNTIDRQKGVLCEDASGNIYDVYMDGAGISYQSLPNGTTTWGGLTTLDAAGTNPAVVDIGPDFTVPLTTYMSASTVKFKGTWSVGTIIPVLVEDVRYNITPANAVSSAVAWVDRETDAGLSLAAALSIHSATEAYSAMTKTTATVDGTTSEDQFVGSGVSNIKATVRLTMTRTSTSVNKGIKSVMGAVGV